MLISLYRQYCKKTIIRYLELVSKLIASDFGRVCGLRIFGCDVSVNIIIRLMYTRCCLISLDGYYAGLYNRAIPIFLNLINLNNV